MEDIARQLDHVRDELVHLLHDYTVANDKGRAAIYRRCEMLGGEVQELVGLLKLAIRDVNNEAAQHADTDPVYADEIERLSRESLEAIHAAGEEVSCAVKLLRESQATSDETS